MMVMKWIKRILGSRTRAETEPLGALSERTSFVREALPPAPLIDADEALVGEFTRARRYEQPLTIVVVSPVQLEESPGGPSASNGSKTSGPDVLPLLVAVGLREALRESDVLCYRPMDRQFVLGLPQSDGDEARQALARVGALFLRRLNIGLVAGVAEFPADGLTLEDLEDIARERSEAVGPQVQSADSGEAPSPREVPPHRGAARSRARPSRPNAPSGVAHEPLGSE